MANILITGGAGYVGSVCCAQLLQRGHRVTVVDDLSTGHRAAIPSEVEFHRVEIGDAAALSTVLARRPFEAVFHFAAKALIPRSVTDPGPFFASNVASSIGMLEVLRVAGIRKIVFSSSAAVYGDPLSVPITEDHPKAPMNSYGETKLMLERVLAWYASAYDWAVVAFRYFNASGATSVAGENHRPETHLIPRLLECAFDGNREVIIFGDDYPTCDGTCIRDYVHVHDIAEAHVRALEVLTAGQFQAYNLGSGTGYSVREVLSVVERVSGRKLRARVGPRRAGDPAVLVAARDKVTRELGWNPRYSDLTEIVRSAWDWIRTHPGGYGATT